MNEVAGLKYRFEKHEKEDTWFVQINEGDYNGLVIKYVNWNVIKTVEVDPLKITDKKLAYHLRFNFVVLVPCMNANIDLTVNNKTLMSILGNILLDIMVAEYEKNKDPDCQVARMPQTGLDPTMPDAVQPFQPWSSTDFRTDQERYVHKPRVALTLEEDKQA